jgi:hypothetical protein
LSCLFNCIDSNEKTRDAYRFSRSSVVAVTKRAAGALPTVSSVTEKMLFVAKKMLSEATKIFSASEKMLFVAETVVSTTGKIASRMEMVLKIG